MSNFEVKRTMFSGGEVHAKVIGEFDTSMTVMVDDIPMYLEHWNTGEIVGHSRRGLT